MKEVQVITTVKIKDGEEVQIETRTDTDTTNGGSYTIYSDDDPAITEPEKERHALVSDLANICEYLTDSEVIKIRLIIDKVEKRL